MVSFYNPGQPWVLFSTWTLLGLGPLLVTSQTTTSRPTTILPSINQIDKLQLKFFINTNFTEFTTMYAYRINQNDKSPGNPDGDPMNITVRMYRARNLVFLELCRCLGSDTGFTYSDGLLHEELITANNDVLTELTTQSTTTAVAKRKTTPTPFGGLNQATNKMECQLTDRLASCTPSGFKYSDLIQVTLSVGTLSPFVVVADVTIPVLPAMDGPTLLARIRWLNLNQLLTINLKWIPTDSTKDCTQGSFVSTNLWLIDDPVVGDHSDIMLGAGLFSLFTFGVAFFFTLYLVRSLHATEKYKETHQYDFDEDDMLEGES